MSTPTRILIGGVVLVLLAGAISFFSLQGLVQSDAVRARIEQEAREALGREVRYGQLSVGILPPRLTLADFRIAGVKPDDPAFLEAGSIHLVLALLPLLTRNLVVDTLRIDGATLNLVRTREGFELPGRGSEASDEARGDGLEGGAASEASSSEAADSKEPTSKQDDEALALAVRRAELHGATLRLEDRSIENPVSWVIQDLDLSVAARALDGPITFQVAGGLESGGSFQAEGNAQVAGTLDVVLELQDLALAPLGHYLESAASLAGHLSGSVRVRRESSKEGQLEADLTLEKAALEFDDVGLEGRLQLEATLTGDLGAPAGTFQVDATQAELVYGRAFRKPVGTPATVSGRLVPGAAGGFEAEDLQVRIRNLEATGRVRLGGEGVALELQIAALSLAGWESLLPDLEGSRLTGRIGPGHLEFSSAPLGVKGELPLDGVEIQSSDGPPIQVDGVLEGKGARLVSRDLTARVANQPFSVFAEITQLDGEAQARLRIVGEDLDSKALLAAFDASRVGLEGPLDLNTDLRTPLGADDLLASLDGTVRFEIRPGRLRGVSLLEKTFNRMGALGKGAHLAAQLRGGKSVERYYDDEFESLTGTLVIKGGVAHTDDLALIYRHYSVALRGSVGLRSRALDLSGTLTIDDEIDASLAEGGEQDEGTRRPGRSQVIRLAKITGTIDAPRVEISDQTVLTFASLYATSKRRTKWERKIDERLGKGSGAAVLDALDQILRGDPKQE